MIHLLVKLDIEILNYFSIFFFKCYVYFIYMDTASFDMCYFLLNWFLYYYAIYHTIVTLSGFYSSSFFISYYSLFFLTAAAAAPSYAFLNLSCWIL